MSYTWTEADYIRTPTIKQKIMSDILNASFQKVSRIQIIKIKPDSYQNELDRVIQKQ